MIEIFRHNNKLGINIKNETLEFEDKDNFQEVLFELTKSKEEKND